MNVEKKGKKMVGVQASYKDDSQGLTQSGLVEIDASLQSHLSVTALIKSVWREIVCRTVL